MLAWALRDLSLTVVNMSDDNDDFGWDSFLQDIRNGLNLTSIALIECTDTEHEENERVLVVDSSDSTFRTSLEIRYTGPEMKGYLDDILHQLVSMRPRLFPPPCINFDSD